MTQNRLHSPVVLAALAGQVLSILVLLEIILPTQSEALNIVVGATLQLLVAFGVLNNPVDKENF